MAELDDSAKGLVMSHLETWSDDDLVGAFAYLCQERPQLSAKMLEAISAPQELSSAAALAADGRHLGVVKKIDDSRNWGFIDCPELKEQYGRDVWIGQPHISKVTVGSQVSFTLTVDAKGQPGVQDVELMDAVDAVWDTGAVACIPATDTASWTAPLVTSNGVGARSQVPVSGLRLNLPQPQVAPAAALSPAAALALIDPDYQEALEQGLVPEELELPEYLVPERYAGTIKKFDPEKRFGFIECPEVHAVCGRDVFLSDLQIGQFGVGSVVSFGLRLNAQGQPQAQDLQDAGGQPRVGGGISLQLPGQQAPLVPAYKVVPPQVPAYKRQRTDVDYVAPLAMPNPQTQAAGGSGGQRHQGLIMKFSQDVGYGFIQCPEVHALYGFDVFLSNKQIGQFDNGCIVSFAYQLKNGKPQAFDLADAATGANF